MKDGIIYSVKTVPCYDGKQITLGEIMDDGDVDEQYFIPRIGCIIQARMLITVMKLISA